QRFPVREPAVLGQRLPADAAQPMAGGVNNRATDRAVSFTLVDTEPGKKLNTASRHSYRLISQRIAPPNAQCCRVHNFSTSTDAKWGGLLHYIFVTFSTAGMCPGPEVSGHGQW